jgi:hypothetical protein
MTKLIALPLTDEESTYLAEVLDIWTQQYEDAKEEIVIDPVIESADDLISAYSSATDDINRGKSILARLRYLRELHG